MESLSRLLKIGDKVRDNLVKILIAADERKFKTYTFGGEGDINVFLTLPDDVVITAGTNDGGVCGLGHKNAVPILMAEIAHKLSGKKIKEYHAGHKFVLGWTADDMIYGWGSNDRGQLATGDTNEVLNRVHSPQLINKIFNENVQQISVGSSHVLVLASDGLVYGWGDNRFGQIGCGLVGSGCVTTMTRLDGISDIKQIHCAIDKSFAITKTGLVLSWGHNAHNMLGHQQCKDQSIFTPKLIECLSSVNSMCTSRKSSYFLTTEGVLYVCGDSVHPSPKVLSTDLRFEFLSSVDYHKSGHQIGCAFDGNLVYELNELTADGLVKTHHKNINNFFVFGHGITPKFLNPRNDLDRLEKCPIRTDLGQGTYGTVSKIEENGESMAMKEFKLDRFYADNYLDEDLVSNVEREFRAISQLKNKHIIKYYGIIVIPKSHIGIKMELCSDNLQSMIDVKHEFFNRNANDWMRPLEYYLTCQMLIEILEGVKFMHSQNPPVMHRDLKPLNILFDAQGKEGAFFKLCDFGISKLYKGFEQIEQKNTQANNDTNGIGTKAYMAPEVTEGGHHSTKSDVFSIGVIVGKLFANQLPFRPDWKIIGLGIQAKAVFEDKFTKLVEIVSKMKHSDPDSRPSCADVLVQTKNWCLDNNELVTCIDVAAEANMIKDIGVNFPDNYSQKSMESLKIYLVHYIKLIIPGFESEELISGTHEEPIPSTSGDNTDQSYGNQLQYWEPDCYPNQTYGSNASNTSRVTDDFGLD